MVWTRITALIINLVLTGGILLNAGHNWIFHGDHSSTACAGESHDSHRHDHSSQSAHFHQGGDCRHTLGPQQDRLISVEVPTDMRQHDRCALLHTGDLQRIAVYLQSARIPEPEYSVAGWILETGNPFAEIPVHYQSRAPPHSS